MRACHRLSAILPRQTGPQINRQAKLARRFAERRPGARSQKAETFYTQGKKMRKNIRTITALCAALSFAAFVPMAEARDLHRHGGQDHGRGHYSHNGYHGGHYRGRGHWHNGQWIALGVGAAILGAAAADNDDCYRRDGRRYCN